MWAQVLVRISVLAALACARPGSAVEMAAEQQSCTDGSSCSMMGQAVQSSALLQMMDHTRRMHTHAQVTVQEAPNFVVVEPNLAVCMTDADCDTESCSNGRSGCLDNVCKHSIQDTACGSEQGRGGRYDGMQPGTFCWDGNKTGLCDSTYVHNEHGGVTLYEARCATDVECQTQSCNEGVFEVQCLDNQCYHNKADMLCQGKPTSFRYEGMQPETWCQNDKKTSRCHSSMEDSNHSLASDSDAACFTDEDCATDDCGKAGFLNIGCTNRGVCVHGTTDCICQGKHNGHTYTGMKPATYCWDGRADGQCSSNMTEDTHLIVSAREAVCQSNDDCQTESCNQPGLDNKGCHWGTCKHGRRHILCRHGYRWEGMQEDTWCHGNMKVSFCESTHEDTIFSASTLRDSLCTSVEDCQTESCNSTGSGIQFACESNQCKQKVLDQNCNNQGNGRSYTGMQPGTWCYSSKKYGFCTSKLRQSNSDAAEPADSMCHTDADCRTDSCDQANWTKQGTCQGNHCWHGNADPLCQGKHDWFRYVGMQLDTWCRSNMKQARCVSAIRTIPTFPVPVSEAICSNNNDCASRECNAANLTNRKCRGERCVHGALDPNCYGVHNNERYMGQQPDTWCYYGRYKESFCKARVEMTEPPTPAPPPTPPAPTPAPEISAATAVEAQCVADADCQTTDCNLAPFVNQGCVLGKCVHGVEDPNCLQKGAGSTYWEMQEDTWCGEGGIKESLCKSQNMGDHRLTMMGCPGPDGQPLSVSCMLVNAPQRFACCGANDNGWSWTYTPCPAVEMTFADAEKECQKNGLFVCTAEQLGSGCNADCDFGTSRAWTSTPCNPF